MRLTTNFCWPEWLCIEGARNLKCPNWNFGSPKILLRKYRSYPG
jgi:hypothetical protein